MQSVVLRVMLVMICTILCNLPQTPALAQDVDDDWSEFAKDDPLAAVSLDIKERLKNSLTYFPKNLSSADKAFKAEQFGESLKIYKEAEILMDQLEQSKNDPEVAKYLQGNNFERFKLALAENYAALAQYRPAKERLTKLLAKQLDPKSTHNPSLTISALNQLVEINTILGLKNEADVQLEQATALATEHRLVDENTIKTNVLLAKRAYRQSKYLDSKTISSEVITLAERLGDRGKPLKADGLDGLARVYLMQGKPVEALKNAEKSFALRKAIFGIDSLEAADSMMNVAMAVKRKDPVEAGKLRLQALSIQRKLLGTAHPTIAYNLLALTDTNEQPHSVAESACEEARSSVAGILGDDTPFFSEYLSKLVRALSSEGKVKPGLDKCKLALALKTKFTGDRSLAVADLFESQAYLKMQDAVLRGMAFHKFKNIQCPEAESSCRQAIRIADEQLGSDSSVSSIYTTTLAWIEKMSGNYKSAEEHCKKTLGPLAAAYGADSDPVRRVRNILLDALVKQDKREEARALSAKMLSHQIKKSGVYSKEVIRLLTASSRDPHLPDKTEKIGDAPQSGLPLRDERQASAESLAFKLMMKMPESDTGLLSSKAILLEHFRSVGAQDDHREQIISLQKVALENQEKIDGNDSPYIVHLIVALAKTYTKEKMYPEADAAFKRAIGIVDAGLGSTHPSLIEILAQYSAMLKASGNETEAAVQAARCELIKTEQTKTDDSKQPAN